MAREVMDRPGVIPMRAGINTGRVFTGDFGPPYRRAYRVLGDAINTAARVMARAEAGQILSTEIVLERSRTTFETTPIEPFSAKGKAEPVKASIVGPIVGRRDERIAETPFVGRERELRALRAVLDDVREGNGWTVEIAGPSGIGKTRLIEEVFLGTPRGACAPRDLRGVRGLDALLRPAGADPPGAGARPRKHAGRVRAPPAQGGGRRRPGARPVGAPARHPARARPAADARDGGARRAFSRRGAGRHDLSVPRRDAGRLALRARRRGRAVHRRLERRAAAPDLACGARAPARPGHRPDEAP